MSNTLNKRLDGWKLFANFFGFFLPFWAPKTGVITDNLRGRVVATKKTRRIHFSVGVPLAVSYIFFLTSKWFNIFQISQQFYLYQISQANISHQTLFPSIHILIRINSHSNGKRLPGSLPSLPLLVGLIVQLFGLFNDLQRNYTF